MTEFWCDAAAKVARKAVPNEAFRAVAVGMATCKPFAVDYIVQAPVLVLAACYGRSDHGFAARNMIRGTFAERIADRPKLRDLMRRYGVAYAFRALRSTAIVPSVGPTVFDISRNSEVLPSALSQALPDRPQAQLAFLKAVASWSLQLANRDRGPSQGAGWAVAAAGTAIREGRAPQLDDLADFYAHDPARFDLRWTHAQACAAMARWHERLGREKGEAAFAKFGIAFTDVIDYAPLPLATSLDGFDILAVDSGEALFAEGAAMHHCVASYAADVVQRGCRIFSIRRSGRRLATLELRIGADAFRPRQLKGPCNAAVSKEVCEVANAFVALVNAAPSDLRSAA